MDSKRFGRTTGHRTAMWRNMAASLFQHGAIRTTQAKAKQLRRFVEKLITTAKPGTLHARRQVIAALGERPLYNNEGDLEEMTLIQKLFNEIAPRYADRAGGYTRIVRLSEPRIGDAGPQVLVQLIEAEPAADQGKSGGPSRRKARAAKRHDAAAAATEEAHGGDAEADEARESGQSGEKAQDDESQQADAEQASQDEEPTGRK